jgi:hypothetical protein
VQGRRPLHVDRTTRRDFEGVAKPSRGPVWRLAVPGRPRGLQARRPSNADEPIFESFAAHVASMAQAAYRRELSPHGEFHCRSVGDAGTSAGLAHRQQRRRSRWSLFADDMGPPHLARPGARRLRRTRPKMFRFGGVLQFARKRNQHRVLNSRISIARPTPQKRGEGIKSRFRDYEVQHTSRPWRRCSRLRSRSACTGASTRSGAFETFHAASMASRCKFLAVVWETPSCRPIST